ncbi:MAG: signal recognition particle-docking protein FtsY [Planctomycetes bacterium]|nr:signal recognition particle-docking protein FtsY [Planctomycetota bacterium]
MIFKKLFKGLSKTREKLASGLKGLFSLGRDLNDDFIEELEEVLYSSDMGSTAVQVIEEVRAAYKSREVKSTDEVYQFLKTRLKTLMSGSCSELPHAEKPPLVILVVGVNGCGKTTSIAKLAWLYKNQGKRVVLGACDTFRAAAVEQLTLWSERIGVDIVKKGTNADPASVAFDAMETGVREAADVVIIDTAGRLHTQENLMQELEKIQRIISRKVPGAPHEVLLVLDATTGQNAVVQARQFSEVVKVTGLFLAKLDGTAKGGAVIAIRQQVEIPVKFVGLGETYEDIEFFDADTFVEAIFD